MTVSYVVETRPSQSETDSASRDAIQQVIYYYDLELDASNTIIGGEWYTNKHPDFLWTPGKGSRAVTRYDSQATGSWSANSAVPAAWQAAAKSASSSQGAPLAVVVENLIKFANGTSTGASTSSSVASGTGTTTTPTNPQPTPTGTTAVNTGPTNGSGASTSTPTTTGGTTGTTTGTSTSTPWWRRILGNWFG